MTITDELAGKGDVLRAFDGASGPMVVFHPLETSYELHLEVPSAYAAPIGRHVRGVVRVKARKIYSVPSGGNFVQPIIGTPRIIQGRVMALDKSTMLVRAGATFVVELPHGQDTIDLQAGDISAGSMVNVVAWPGAAFSIQGAK